MAGMFKPTPSLQKRIEARLRGWRGPSVGILRQESKRTDPLALDPPFLNALHDEPQRALSAEEAYNKMGLPMQDILEMRGGTRRAVERDDVLLGPRPRGFEVQEPNSLDLAIAKSAQKVRAAGPYRRRVGAEEMSTVRKVNPMRYKPPATNYWRHSIYAYNKETIKNLPATTMNANKLVRAYFNMIPKSDYAKEILSGATKEGESAAAAASANTSPAPNSEDPSATPDKPSAGEPKPSKLAEMSPEDRNKAIATARSDFERTNRLKFKEHKTTASRIYISDRGSRSKAMLRQDVLGKINPRMQPKMPFYYPYKELQATSPQITYKHWRDGVGVSVHVHEGVDEERAPKRRA